ncbi:MAG: formate dehydrogenase delta subunit [Burkholderiaceae bacterium]|nr:formate dehydrogenase delta subunit [Burkholderiaceae bacterium]
MDNDRLVKMCNQIGAFFESMPDRQKGAESMAAHLKNFWAPAMRQQLLAHWEQGEAEELSPFAAQTLREYRQILQ